MGMEEIFSSGAKSRLEGAKKIYPLKRFLPPGHNKQEGRAEYLIMAKERLVLASAPYAPHNSFFIRGTFRGALHMHPLFDLSGAYAPYAPWLHTPLFLIFSLCFIFSLVDCFLFILITIQLLLFQLTIASLMIVAFSCQLKTKILSVFQFKIFKALKLFRMFLSSLFFNRKI